MHRREFLLAGAAAAAAKLCAQSASPSGLGVRFRTDSARLARLLPGGFAGSAEPHAQFEVASDASWARVLIAARYGQQEGWFPVALWTSTDRQRFVAREALGVGANAAEISVDETHARVAIAGAALIELNIGQGTGDALAPDDRPIFGIQFSAHEDWTEGVVSGAGGVLAIDWTSGERTAADAPEVTLKWLRSTPSEPASELPILEVLHAWRLTSPDSITTAIGETEAIGTISNSDLAAWSPLRYPRPSIDRVISRPDGWPDQTTALRWTDAESDRWQARRETRFNPVEIIEVNGIISPEVHAQLLPPPCVAGTRPLVKMMGLRFEPEGELPFNELWLMAYCGIGRQGAWYTLAHVVGPGGDLVYGREAFGYPTKSGDPRVVLTPIDCSLSGSRGGREFFYADGAFGGFSTGTTLGRFNILSLRVRPGQRTGELVLQPWKYQGRRQQVTPITAAMAAPDGESPQGGVRLDPWYDLGPMQIASIAALETGLMQRAPGQVVATVADPAPYYRERCDGVLPWEAEPTDPPQPSLTVSPDDLARS
jgi:hypothetical protein